MRHAQGYSYNILRSDSMTSKTTKTVPSAATATVTVTTQAIPSYFSRKIGNTTFVVSVSFNEKSKESMDDKILKLVASEIQNGEVQKCS